MSTPFATEVDVRVALSIDDKWLDITDYVAYERGVEIERGSDHDTPRLESSVGRMTLLPADGRFMRLNPESDLYGKLMMDQPVRIDRYLVHQDFSVAASNGLSPTDEGLTWTLYGEGGVVQNSDFSVSGGTARFSVPVANAHRIAYLPDAYYRNGEVITSVQFPQADITGGGVGAAIILRGQAGNSYAQCEMFIDTDETISVVTSFTSNVPPAGGEINTGITHTGQRLWIAAGADGHSLYMKVWEGTIDDEPVDWMEVGDGSFFGAGFIGLKATRFSGNTNASPMVVQWGEFYFRQPRLVGVVPNWSPKWDKTGRFEHTPIQVSGIVRRLDNDETPASSPLRVYLPTTAGLVAYWSCEDDSGAQSFASAFPDASPMTWSLDDGQTPPSVSSYGGFIASRSLPTVGKARWRGVVPDHEETGIAHVRFLAHFPSSDMDNLAIIQQFYVTGTALRWELKYLTGGSCQLDCYDRNDVNILAVGPFAYALQDKKVRFAVQLEQSGADINWLVGFIEEGNLTPTQDGGTLSGYTVGRVHDLRYAVGNPTVNYGDLAIGHITVSNADTEIIDMIEPFNAFDGELDWQRAQRTCDENGIDFRTIGGTPLDSTPMGPQPIAKPIEILNSCADTGQNVIYETRSVHNGITFRLHSTLRNQDKQLELSLSGKELEDNLEPDDDPDRRFNDITAKRNAGSAYRVTKTDGPFAISVIGDRPRDYPCNPQLDAMLPDIANFQLVRNTIDEYLYSKIASSLDNSAIRLDHDKARKMLDLELYDRMIIKDGENRKLFNEIEQLPRGYKEHLDQFTHSFVWNTTQGSPYLTLELGDSEYDSLTSRATALLSDINTTETLFSITREPGEPMWSTTDPPDHIQIGGEVMELVSVGNPATPVFVAVGTVAHANNANVTPGLPGGTTTTGDTLIFVAWLRNNGMTATLSDADYQLVGNAGNIKIWVKAHDGSEAAPTLQVSGGIAGDSVSAQMCSIRNVGPFPVAADVTSTGAQQNINVPGDYEPQATWLAIQIGWKADDFTSVTPPIFMTEIAEHSTTLGNDQGGTWAYKIGTDHVNVGDGAFAVTGGASAVTVGVIMVWGTRQTMTVVRSANNVVKEHSAGDAITAWREVYLGLGRS